MSSQAFRKITRVVLTNMDLKFIQSSNDTYRNHSSKHLNIPDVCKVCGGGRSFDIQTKRIEPLVGHHVKYFPPVIAFVHYCCHKKIHDKDNPISKLIEYGEGDSDRYYDLKRKYLNSHNRC
ncbi:MAG: hypothetical protein IIC67_05505 [Thaumarchaeota archaeon]|nr:hypothetical protein [Nitrososphaerota archaeon]